MAKANIMAWIICSFKPPFDIGIEAYVGMREGVSAKVQMNYEF